MNPVDKLTLLRFRLNELNRAVELRKTWYQEECENKIFVTKKLDMRPELFEEYKKEIEEYAKKESSFWDEYQKLIIFRDAVQKQLDLEFEKKMQELEDMFKDDDEDETVEVGKGVVRFHSFNPKNVIVISDDEEDEEKKVAAPPSDEEEKKVDVPPSNEEEKEVVAPLPKKSRSSKKTSSR